MLRGRPVQACTADTVKSSINMLPQDNVIFRFMLTLQSFSLNRQVAIVVKCLSKKCQS